MALTKLLIEYFACSEMKKITNVYDDALVHDAMSPIHDRKCPQDNIFRVPLLETRLQCCLKREDTLFEY